MSPTTTLSPPPPLWGLDGEHIALAVLGLLLVALGVAAAVRAFVRIEPGDAARLRTLIVAFAVASGGFWIGLGAIALAFAFRGVLPGDAAVLYPVPLVMAGIRLLTAQAINRNLPQENRRT